jgi:hypothetical protein
MTPYETRSMRAPAALRMVWASAAWMAVEMLATWLVCLTRMGIRKKITEMKMRLIKVALKATGRG